LAWRRTLARRSTSEWGKGGKKVDSGLEEEAEIKQEEDDAPRSRKRKFEQEEEGQTRAREIPSRVRESGGKRRCPTKVAPGARKHIKEEAEEVEEENRGNQGAVAMRIYEESSVEEQSTRAKGREVKRRSQTKVVHEARKCSREEAEGGEEEARVAKGDVALRGVEASAVVDVVELPNFQIDQATSLIQEECSSIEGEEGEQKDESVEEEASNASTPRLLIDQSRNEEVMEVSVTVRKNGIKEEAPVVFVEEQVNILLMVKKAKEMMLERNEKIKRLGNEKEIKGARLAHLKSEEAEDLKRLEEIGRSKMELERSKMELELEELEIKRKVRERDIEVIVVKQVLEEKTRTEARHKAELKKELEALRNTVKEMDVVKELMESLPSSADVAQ